MGSGIAEVSARAGLRTVVLEGDDELAARGQSKITASLDRAVLRGKLPEADRDAALALVTVTSDLLALEDCDIVVEAVAEIEEAKSEVFRQIDQVVKSEDAVLASNTSSLPIMKLAMATQRPGSVVGIHFFNPVPVLDLVEIVPSLLTADETVAAARQFAEGHLGKHVIASKDRPGSWSTPCSCRTC